MKHFLLPLALCLAVPAAAQTVPAAPIRLNQLGFETDGPKRAMLGNGSQGPIDWELVDARGGVVLHGRTMVFGPDAAAGETVHVIDFSGFRLPGRGYRIRIGAMESHPFEIGPRPRGHLAADALAFFYHQRAGVPIEARFVGTEWARPAGHPREVAACFAGRDVRGTDWPGCPYKLDVHGGWYDAGDHGKYVVNGGIALWTLLNAYEHKPSHFADRAARIPEAGNRVPDLLDEARYEMEFLLRMQVPEGTKTRVPVGPLPLYRPPNPASAVAPPPPPPLTLTEIDASGMVHLKVADRNWTKLPMPPQDDPAERLVYPPTTSATLNLAATAAQCARIWRSIDRVFAVRCLAAAERAWAAAKRNPEVYAAGAFTGSGGYGDRDVSDEFFWAAAELYATTDRAEFADYVRKSPYFSGVPTEPGWPRTATLGLLTLSASKLPATDLAHVRTMLVLAADTFLAEQARTGYHIPYAPAVWPWGSSSNLLNRAIVIAYARDITGDRKYRDAVIDSVDYLLGRNPIDQSFISGYGARPMRNPHHRFWAHSLDPKLPGPPPGVLSGGPNSGFMSDEVGREMKGKCAPMACYADDIRAFSLNEVAINWNAPLFWVASWLDE